MRHPPVVAAVAVLMITANSRASAQGTNHAEASKASAKTAIPDLSGVWRPERKTYTLDPSDPLGMKGVNPPMTSWGEAKFKANKPAHGIDQTPNTNDPFMKCLPPGIPRIYLEAAYPIQIFQLPDRAIMLFEYDHFWREIFTDGRPHPKDADPTWTGNAIGHYAGSILVVDTTGFNDRTWLDRVGHPHSEELRVIERLRKPTNDGLQDDITIDDPKTYMKPWGGTKTWKLTPGWELLEDACIDSGDYLEYQKKAGATLAP